MPCSHWEPSEFRAKLASPCSFCQNPASLPVQGQVTPPHALCWAHPSHCLWLRATHSPAAGVGCGCPGSHSESLFFPENPAKWQRQCNPCSCAQAQALGRRGCGAGQLIWAESLRQTLSALGVWEGNEEGERPGRGSC